MFGRKKHEHHYLLNNRSGGPEVGYINLEYRCYDCGGMKTVTVNSNKEFVIEP